MSIESQFEREEAHIIEMMNSGEISNAEGWKQIRELQRDYRAAAQEAAQEAYDRELERW
jgi:hypothetical protein